MWVETIGTLVTRISETEIEAERPARVYEVDSIPSWYESGMPLHFDGQAWWTKEETPVETMLHLVVPDANTVAHVDEATALKIQDYYPEWVDGMAYEVGYRTQFGGVLYQCLQAHTSQPEWNPIDATSLWAQVLIPDPSVIPDWVQPSSTNPYMRGDKVRHNGHVWVSLVDNNVWEPSLSVPTIWQMEE